MTRRLAESKADPKGRLDILVARVFDRIVSTKRDPLVTALYETFQPLIDRELRKLNRPKVKRLVKAVIDEYAGLVQHSRSRV